jgi:hypothetical protein
VDCSYELLGLLDIQIEKDDLRTKMSNLNGKSEGWAVPAVQDRVRVMNA